MELKKCCNDCQEKEATIVVHSAIGEVKEVCLECHLQELEGPND